MSTWLEKTQACSTVVGEAKWNVIFLTTVQHSPSVAYSYWNISLFYYSMSWHQICVWAQTCLDTKYVSGHRRVWAQTYTFLPRHDCDHTIITCQGTNVSRHKHVWAQTCLGTNVSAHKCVWAQTWVGTNVSGHNRVGSSMYGHKRVVCLLHLLWSKEYICFHME